MSKCFTPIRGTEETIRNLNIEDGHIYFASDTGHVYMDKDAETRITISGRGSGVFLFNDTNPSIDYHTGYYRFPISKLTYTDMSFYPNTIQSDDIIVNIPSGELFRVLKVDYQSINKVSVLCATSQKISITGAAGGSSGGTSGLDAISLELLSTLPYRFVYGREAYATFMATAVGSTDINIVLTVIAPDGTTHQRTKMVQSGEEFTIEFGTLLFIGDNTIKISANGDNIVNSGTIEKQYRQRQATNLELRRPEGSGIYTYQTGDSVSLSYIPIGAVEKQIELLIDERSVYTELLPSNISGAVRNITITREMMVNELAEKPLSGDHAIELRLTASDEDGNNTIEAEPLQYELAWVDDNTSVPIIWFPTGTPTTVNQYETINIDYMVFDVNSPKGMDVILIKGETPIANLSLDYIPGQVHTWTLNELTVGTNSFTIKCGNTERTFSIECRALTERDLSIIKDGLILNLDAFGRSNSEDIENRYSWPLGEKTKIQFNNFNWYNNGWITDEKTGLTCLRISNGASLSIPFNKLNSEQLARSLALEFRFKIRNVRKYTTLTTRGVVEGDDEEETVLTLNTTDSVCGKFFGPQKGLLIGTQEAVFTYGPTLSVRYKEDEIINLSLVFDATQQLIYMYLNGVLSSALHYNNYANLNVGSEWITFNSDYCDVDLYSIRAYETDTVFSIENVIHNYIATLNGVERLNAYDTNQIISYNYDTKEPYIDYYKMIAYNEEHPDTPLMPYAIVKTMSADDLLPYRKGDEKAVEVTFVNPYLDYLWDIRDKMSETEKLSAHQYLTSCPSFHFISQEKNFNVQGTSSQGYPRRNYKLKTKMKATTDGGDPEKNYWVYTSGPLKGESVNSSTTYEEINYKNWYMDSDLPADKFCWKADYMESSGSYNTGFANFASILYEHHPLYNVLNKNVAYDAYRTSVYGFPMLVFQEKQAKAGNDDKAQYEFVGKYNFNLDKSSNTRYGFELNTVNAYVAPWDEIITKVDGSTKTIHHETSTIKEIAECWEFTNNQGTYCSFRTPWPKETLPDNFDLLSADEQQAAIAACSFKPIAEDSFEYRYSPDDKALDALTFQAGISRLNINPSVPVKGKTSNGFKPIREYFANFKVLYDWLYNIGQYQDAEGNRLVPDDMTLEEAMDIIVQETDSEEVKELKNARLEKVKHKTIEYFKAHFDEYLNKEYCFVYFILTELLHCYDSRGKNVMMASWGPEKAGGNYIWYPIFYDIDTQLGLNNSGEQLWDYYAEPTDNDDFSTSNSVLWNFLWDAYSTEIKEKYNSIRTSEKISYENVDGYYNFNSTYTHSLAMKGQRPLAVYNIDEYYKYIAPSLTGFIDTSGNIANDSWGHLYCLQGTRELSRALYLRNRINYLDSKWLGGAYAYTAVNGGGFETRLNANYDKTSDMYIVGSAPGYVTENNNPYDKDTNPGGWPNPLDANPEFTIRPFLKQYVSVYYDRTATEPVLNDDIQKKTIFSKVEKVYTITNDDPLDPNKQYYFLDNHNVYQPLSLSNDDNGLIDNADYGDIYERAYPVTPDNVVNYYVKDLNGIDYIEAAEGSYSEDTVYYELVELIPTNPIAATNEYVTVKPDEATINIYKSQPNHTQQLAYVTGAEYVADLGDLSNKYFNQFNIAGAYRLERLILGSDNHIGNKMYENKVLKNILLATSKDDLHPKSLLKEIVLNGLTQFNSFLDITGCEKLEIFRALRTALPQVAFADGVQLNTLHLPNSINTLSLRQANKLTKVINSPVDENENPQEGLYIEGLTNTETAPDSTNIIKISIEGDSLGYDSYKLLTRLVETKQKMKNRANQENITIDSNLSIGMRQINWSPYTIVPYGSSFNNNITYYLDTGRFTLQPIVNAEEKTRIENNWEHYLSNNLIFVKTDEQYGETGYDYPIENLNLLKTFIYDTRVLKDENNPVNIDTDTLFEIIEKTNPKEYRSETQFSNDDQYEDQISLPDITGVLFIENANDRIIDEMEIKAYQTYFPKLRIFGKNVRKGAKITYMYYKNTIPQVVDDAVDNVNNILEYTELAQFSTEAITINHFPVPKKEHYTFLGWKQFDVLTRKPVGAFVTTSTGDTTSGNSITVNAGSEYTLIALFDVQIYNITFIYQRSSDNLYSLTDPLVIQCAYNEQIPFPDVTQYYPWRDDSALPHFNQTYRFLGYDKNADATTATFTQGSKQYASNNTTYYATFKVDDITKNVLPNVFFKEAEENGIVKMWFDMEKGQVLRGRITVPSVTPSKKKYSIFGEGRDYWTEPDEQNVQYPITLSNVTHIFWNGTNANFTKINTRCFSRWYNLQAVMLPDSVTTLGVESFFGITGSLNGSFGNVTRFGIGGYEAQQGYAQQEYLNYFFRNLTVFEDRCLDGNNANFVEESNFPFHSKIIPINGNIQYNGASSILSRTGIGRINQPGRLQLGAPMNPLNSEFIDAIIEHDPAMDGKYFFSDNINQKWTSIYRITIYSTYFKQMYENPDPQIQAQAYKFLEHLYVVGFAGNTEALRDVLVFDA